MKRLKRMIKRSLSYLNSSSGTSECLECFHITQFTFSNYGNDDAKTTCTASTYDAGDSISQYSSTERDLTNLPLSIKLITSNHTFRLSLESEISFNQFIQQTQKSTELRIDKQSMFYKDEDGDLILLNCDAALNVARALARSHSWKKIDIILKNEETPVLKALATKEIKQMTLLIAGGAFMLALGWLLSNGSRRNDRYDQRHYYR